MNALPSLALLRRCISPPSRFASSRLIARPNPVPPYRRLVLASACWNASKMMRCFSGGMPMPVSVTSNAMTVAAVASTGWSGVQPDVTLWTRMRTPPCSVNLIAFESRFFEHLLEALRVGREAAQFGGDRRHRTRDPAARPRGGMAELTDLKQTRE